VSTVPTLAVVAWGLPCHMVAVCHIRRIHRCTQYSWVMPYHRASGSEASRCPGRSVLRGRERQKRISKPQLKVRELVFARHGGRSSTGRNAWDYERVYRACSRLSKKALTASAWSLLSMVSASSAASMSANAVSSRIRIAFSDRLAQRIASGGSDASS
jgi:hypothetical protein